LGATRDCCGYENVFFSSFPMFDHVNSFRLQTLENGRSWKLETIFKTLFFWTRSNWTVGWHAPKMNNLVIGLSDNPRGVNVTYRNDGNVRTVVMKYEDKNQITYRCIGRPDPTGKSRLSIICMKSKVGF